MEPNFDFTDNESTTGQINEEIFEDVEYLDEYIHLGLKSDQQLNFDEKSNKLLVMLCTLFYFLVFCIKTLFNLMQLDQDNIKTIQKLEMENRMLKISMKSQTIKHHRQLDKYLQNFRKIFNDDQIDIIFRHLKRPAEWSDKTILKALRTKFACKKGGYNHLLREGYPYPSLVTLRTKLQGLDFEPGILNEVFMFMKEKVKSFSEQDKECQLVIDEMSIIEGNFINHPCSVLSRSGIFCECSARRV